jgi:hypothetical protein
MTNKDRARRIMPKGFCMGGDMRIAVRFNDELFKRIKERALTEKKTFSEMVSELCVVGLLDLEESDSHEAAE